MRFSRTGLFVCVATLMLCGSMFADVTYSFSGQSGNGNPSFSFTVPVLFADGPLASAHIDGSSMTTCNTGNALYTYCAAAAFFSDGAGLASTQLDYDQLGFVACTDASCTSFLDTEYFFDDGAFNADGTYTTDGPATAEFDTAQGLVRSAGTLTITGTAAPEPSSLLLLGTGLIGGFGVMRRKLMK